MARFDVYRNEGALAASTPFLLDVQSDLLEGLETRVVVPLRDKTQFPQVRIPERLMPALDVAGVQCLMETPKLAAVPQRILKRPVISLACEQGRILAALDFLFQGY